MYAGIVAVTPMGLGRYFAVDWLECWLCRWEYVD
jgi:hypothetical protein